MADIFSRARAQTRSGYLTGREDPYRTLRGQIGQEIAQTPLDPRQDPRYQAYLPELQREIEAGYASRGMGDSGLTEKALTQAKTGLYTNLYGQNRALRLQGYGLQAGIPYLRDTASMAGLGGGGGGVGYHDPFASAQRDEALRLQRQQMNIAAGQTAQAPYQLYSMMTNAPRPQTPSAPIQPQTINIPDYVY